MRILFRVIYLILLLLLNKLFSFDYLAQFKLTSKSPQPIKWQFFKYRHNTCSTQYTMSYYSTSSAIIISILYIIFGSLLIIKNTSCFYNVTRKIQAHYSVTAFINQQTPYHYIRGGLAATSVVFLSQQHHTIITTPHSLYYYHPSNYVV